MTTSMSRLQFIFYCGRNTENLQDVLQDNNITYKKIFYKMTALIQELYISLETVASYTLNNLGTVSNGI